MPLNFDKKMSVLEPPKREDIPADLMAELDATVDEQQKKMGFVFPFYYVYPMNPEAFRGMEYFAKSFLRCESYLTFREKEMIAIVTSSINRCSGCLTGHTAKMRLITGDNRLAEQLGFNFHHAEGLSERDRAICDYACELTKNIADIDSEAWAERMRSVGMNDHEILETVMVTAYYNFSNRCATGLNIKTPEQCYRR